MQRRVYSTYREGNLVNQEDLTYDYDKEAGRGQYTSSRDGTTHEIPCKPGTRDTIGGVGDGEYVVSDPLGKDRRDLVGPDGRMDLIDERIVNNKYYNVGYYAIYTMDENGYPVYIETFNPDGALTGTCTLEWKTIG